MNIILIGGSGFIGTRLTRRLLKNSSFNIKIADKAPSKSYNEYVVLADVRDLNQLRNAISEDSTIINLAAEHRDNVEPKTLYDAVNVEGARNIVNIAKEKDIKKIIFISSVAVYGFAPANTDENGEIRPFNDYGRTKYEAEVIYKAWQDEKPQERTLVIIRPTVVFGEQNRGNVYNLLSKIVHRKFIMIGSGKNMKSMAYVENVAAFIEHSLQFGQGVHIYNYIDKPDFTMNKLVASVNKHLGRSEKTRFRIPYFIGYSLAKIIDLAAHLTGLKFGISAIRVKKFCSNTTFDSSISKSGFIAPVSLEKALQETISYEFSGSNQNTIVFYSE